MPADFFGISMEFAVAFFPPFSGRMSVTIQIGSCKEVSRTRAATITRRLLGGFWEIPGALEHF